MNKTMVNDRQMVKTFPPRGIQMDQVRRSSIPVFRRAPRVPDDSLTDIVRQQAFVLASVLELVTERNLDAGASFHLTSVQNLESIKLSAEALLQFYKDGAAMPSKAAIKNHIEDERSRIVKAFLLESKDGTNSSTKRKEYFKKAQALSRPLVNY